MVDDEDIKGAEGEGADQSRREGRDVYRSCNICGVLGGLAHMAERDVDWEGIKEVFEDPGMGSEPLLIDGRDIRCSLLDGPTGLERSETPGAASPAPALGGLPPPSPGRLIFLVNDASV